mmetsp:Transcript_13410/g.39598  ORF Transcript_13410/g.39598 Transcript_13410/m.39598 type:complete len:127 (-) Transcript_13410:577-957(-)
MRIEVPSAGVGNGQGPLSAPPNLGNPYGSAAALAAGISTPTDEEPPDAPPFAGAKGTPSSPQDQRYLSEKEKVNLWLPGASVDSSVDASVESLPVGCGRPASGRRHAGLSNPSSPTMELLETTTGG